MDVLIIATKDCAHRPILEKIFQEMNVDYGLRFVEDNPGDMKKYQIRNSPNIIVDGKIVFRASPQQSLPTDEEMKEFVNQ